VNVYVYEYTKRSYALHAIWTRQLWTGKFSFDPIRSNMGELVFNTPPAFSFDAATSFSWSYSNATLLAELSVDGDTNVSEVKLLPRKCIVRNQF
jgi:hypothetical protein